MNRNTAIGLATVLGLSCAALATAALTQQPVRSGAQFYALRLEPGQDLRQELAQFAKTQKLRAGFIASCSGSVACAAVRYANQNSTAIQQGHYEIVSLSGTIEADAMHLHAAFSDSTGATFGGHLENGTVIFTTAEIVVGELSQLAFTRENDTTTGFRELMVRKR
jgi:predicted DNA-binding protein with PD1-like motif